MFKSISNGRTGLYKVWRYLMRKNEREVLGKDTFNIVGEENQALWYRPMDALREAYGNDAAWNGKRAVTYRHYLISPDPKDNCGLETLRTLVKRWVSEFFAEYQVAVVYHDDNRNHIPHAHIIVNNTNMLTGKRLHVSNAMRDVNMPNLVQTLAHQLKLSTLPNLHSGPDEILEQGQERASEAAKRARIRPGHNRNSQEYQRPETGSQNGRWRKSSWVEQIREQVERVATEAQEPLTFDEFRERMQAAGYDVYQTKRGYTYVHPEGYTDKQGTQQHWKITGKRLGLKYTPYGMARWMGVGAEQPVAKEMVTTATKREAAAYRRYQELYLALIPDISTQDRLDALAAIAREGIERSSDFRAVRAQLNQGLTRLEEKAAAFAMESERVGTLLRALTEYERLLPVATQYNEHSSGPNRTMPAEWFLQAHGKDLEAFQTARNVLEEAGIKSSDEIEALRNRAAKCSRKENVLAGERAAIETRIYALQHAQSISEQVQKARSEARMKTSEQYAYRGANCKTSERIELRRSHDERGNVQYDVVRTRETRYRKIEAMRQSREAVQKMREASQERHEALDSGTEPVQEQPRNAKQR